MFCRFDRVVIGELDPGKTLVLGLFRSRSHRRKLRDLIFFPFVNIAYTSMATVCLLITSASYSVARQTKFPKQTDAQTENVDVDGFKLRV